MIDILERNLKKFLADKTLRSPEDIGFNLDPFPEISWSNPSERNIRMDYGDMKIHLAYKQINDTGNIYIILDLIHQEDKGDPDSYFIRTRCMCPYMDASSSIGYNNNGIIRLQNGFKLEAVIISILSAINSNDLEITSAEIHSTKNSL